MATCLGVSSPNQVSVFSCIDSATSNDGYDNEHYDYIFSMYDEIRN